MRQPMIATSAWGRQTSARVIARPAELWPSSQAATITLSGSPWRERSHRRLKISRLKSRLGEPSPKDTLRSQYRRQAAEKSPSNSALFASLSDIRGAHLTGLDYASFWRGAGKTSSKVPLTERLNAYSAVRTDSN